MFNYMQPHGLIYSFQGKFAGLTMFLFLFLLPKNCFQIMNQTLYLTLSRV